MTELEILAGLKIAYEYIVDIEDNAEIEQMGKFAKEEIFKIEDKLETVYWEVYKRILEENKELLIYKENLKIGDSIYIDYTTIDNGVKYDITYKDMDNEEKWWENYSYLLK